MFERSVFAVLLSSCAFNTTTTASMTATLSDQEVRKQLEQCADNLLAARKQGTEEEFQQHWMRLCCQIELALENDTLTPETVRMAHSVSQTVQSLASGFIGVDQQAAASQRCLRQEIGQCLNSVWLDDAASLTLSSKSTTLPFAWVQPLLEFVSANIRAPYPSQGQKKTLLENCVSGGWISVTQRKLEDWLNVARGKMGYTFILKSDPVDEDRKIMAEYVHRVLFGTRADRKGIPPALVRRIEMMQQWVDGQYERRAGKDQTSSWAHDVVDLVQRLSVPDDVGPDAVCDADEEESLSDDTDCDDYDSSDSDTLYSESDVEDDDETSPASNLGAKRKYSGLGLGHPPARTVSRASSSSSLSSQGTLADLSDSEASRNVHTTIQLDGKSGDDRPTKRRRTSRDETSPTRSAVAESPPAAVRPTEQPYRSRKRKRISSEDDSSSSPLKLVGQLDPLTSHVPLSDLDALATISQLDWDSSLPSVEVDVDIDLDWDGDVCDASPLDAGPDVDQTFDIAVSSNESPGDPPVGTGISWCNLQVYTLERMLRHGVHIVPSPYTPPTDPTPSITVDASLFNPEELAYLSSLSMQDPDVGQACVEPPDLVEPGPNCPGVLGLSPWSADLSDPSLSDGTALPSVAIDEWITSLLNEPFSS